MRKTNLSKMVALLNIELAVRNLPQVSVLNEHAVWKFLSVSQDTVIEESKFESNKELEAFIKGWLFALTSSKEQPKLELKKVYPEATFISSGLDYQFIGFGVVLKQEMLWILDKYKPTVNHNILSSSNEVQTQGKYCICFGGAHDGNIRVEWIHKKNRMKLEIAATSSPYFESAIRDGEHLGKGVYERIPYVRSRFPVPGKRMTFYGGYNYYYAGYEQQAQEIYEFILNIFGDGNS